MTNKRLDDNSMSKGIFSADDYGPRESDDLLLGGDFDCLSSYPNVTPRQSRFLLSGDEKNITCVVRCPLMMPSIPGHHEGTAAVYWTYPDVPFKPTHLLMWGISTASKLVYLRVLNKTIIPISSEPVTAMLYDTPFKIAELDNRDLLSEFKPSFLQSIEAPICSPACRISIAVEGPVTAIAFLGLITL